MIRKPPARSDVSGKTSARMIAAAEDICPDVADAPSYGFVIALRSARQPGVDLDQLGGQPLALSLEHGAFLLGPRAAATQDVALAGGSVRVGDQPDFQPGLHLLPVGFIQQGRACARSQLFGVPTR